MSKVLTESSFFEDKVRLRIKFLPERNPVRILDCFSANARIWNEISRRGKNIELTRIEKEKGRAGFYLLGDNMKYLSTLDLNQYDVIDLDAFGLPYKQLEKIFERIQLRNTKTQIVYVTFIQSYIGALSIGLLTSIGYTEKMIKRCPTLFYRAGFDKLKEYLAIKGIQEINYISHSRKHYLAFSL